MNLGGEAEGGDGGGVGSGGVASNVGVGTQQRSVFHVLRQFVRYFLVPSRNDMTIRFFTRLAVETADPGETPPPCGDFFVDMEGTFEALKVIKNMDGPDLSNIKKSAKNLKDVSLTKILVTIEDELDGDGNLKECTFASAVQISSFILGKAFDTKTGADLPSVKQLVMGLPKDGQKNFVTRLGMLDILVHLPC